MSFWVALLQCVVTGVAGLLLVTPLVLSNSNAAEYPVCNCAAGFVSARLRGVFGVTRDDRIDLEFENITLNIGPFKAAEKVGGNVSTHCWRGVTPVES